MSKAARNAFVILAAGLWSAAWSVLPHAIYHQLDEPQRSQMLETASIAGMALAKRMSVTAVSGLAVQTMAAFLAAVIAASAWRAVLGWLDRGIDSAPIVRWGLRSAPMLGLWSAGPIAGMALALCLPERFEAIGWLIAIGSLFVLPLICWRSEIVNAPSPPRFWAPAWPGGYPVAFVAIIAALYFALSTGLAIAGGVIAWSAPVLALVEFSIASVLLASAAAPWLQHAQGKQTLRAARHALCPVPLRAVLAVQWRIQGLFLLVLGSPILIMAVDLIFFMPQATASFASVGQDVPNWLSRWAAFEDWVRWAWYVPATAILAWMGLICTGRALKQADALNRPD